MILRYLMIVLLVLITPKVLALEEVSYPVPISVLVDSNGALTLQQLLEPTMQKAFSEPKESFVGGYTRNVFWFKATLTPFKDDLWLEIQPPYLDHVDVYIPDHNGQYQKIAQGDLIPFNSRSIPYRHFVVPIDIKSSTDIYIRVQTHSSSILTVKAWSRSAFQSAALKEYFVFALVIGGLISLFIFNLRQAVWRQDITYRAFLVYLAVLIIALLSYNGFLAHLVLSDMPRVASTTTAVITAMLFAAILWVYQRFLFINWPQKPIQFIILMLSYGLAMLLGLGGLTGFYVDIAPYFGIWVIALYFLWLIDSLKLLVNKQYDSVWLVTASVSGLMGSVAMILVLLGLFNLETVGLYAFQVGAVVTVLSFQMAISGQVNRKLNNQLKVEQQIAIANRMLEQESQTREVQESFLAMLTHELKTPLSIIKMSLMELDKESIITKHSLQAVEDINRVVELSRTAQWLEQTGLTLNKEPINLLELLDEIVTSVDQTKQRFVVEVAHNCQANVYTDVAMLKIIFNNLIDNALKYGSHTPILLTLKCLKTNPAHVVVEITNQEGGFGQPDPHKIFEKYYREPKAYRKTGSGLGLFIVKGLVEQLGAQIHYRYQSKQITFAVHLPQFPQAMQ